MNFKPLHDRIVVKSSQVETKTAGGIIIPTTAEEKPTIGTVIAVGDGYTNEKGVVRPLVVHKGDTIMFSKWAGTALTIDNEEVLVMKEQDVIGVLSQ